MKDGRVGVMLENGKDLFDVEGRSFQDTAAMCQQFRNELRVITNVIDALGLV